MAPDAIVELYPRVDSKSDFRMTLPAAVALQRGPWIHVCEGNRGAKVATWAACKYLALRSGAFPWPALLEEILALARAMLR